MRSPDGPQVDAPGPPDEHGHGDGAEEVAGDGRDDHGHAGRVDHGAPCHDGGRWRATASPRSTWCGSVPGARWPRWPGSAPTAVRLARGGGPVFWRLLGTGRGSDTGVGVDPRRTALFALWDDDAALDTFLARSPIARRWRDADEAYTVRLRRLGGHGTWRGVAVLDGMAAATDGADADAGAEPGPVAVLTRATVRVRHWPAFIGAGRRVSAEVAAAPGLLAVVGIGEAPVGRQATFSLWRSTADAHAFAYGRPDHLDAVRRTRAEGLVRRAAVRPLPALRQRRHLGRSRPPGRLTPRLRRAAERGIARRRGGARPQRCRHDREQHPVGLAAVAMVEAVGLGEAGSSPGRAGGPARRGGRGCSRRARPRTPRRRRSPRRRSGRAHPSRRR